MSTLFSLMTEVVAASSSASEVTLVNPSPRGRGNKTRKGRGWPEGHGGDRHESRLQHVWTGPGPTRRVRRQTYVVPQSAIGPGVDDSELVIPGGYASLGCRS